MNSQSHPMRGNGGTEGGIDLQAKLFERDRESGKEIPRQEIFPKVESPMNLRLIALNFLL